MRFFRLILSLLLPLLLTGCFTGIESTPRITASDVKRENAQIVSPEKSYGSSLVADSLSQWRRGREFRVVDSRIKLLFTSTSDGSLPPVGSVIRYLDLMPVPSLLGDTVTLVRFTSANNPADTLNYKMDATPQELRSRPSLTIPFVIDLELVSKIDSMLKGKTLYPLTPTRYVNGGERVLRSKFMPVTVVSVTPGNTDFPLSVNFTQSGDPVTYSLLMSAGTGKLSTRNFDSLFSLTDPRANYPLITDENWEAITHGMVRPDMTRDECRLSLGSPAEVLHGHSYSSTYERWIYPSGTMLEFEDGLLKNFRR
ncbi:MAG: hypothetical protein K2O00_00040 [Muribaculaceae bacterium]|nr:hypothetical protein [Muribaculaceae bacterium]